MPVASVMEYIHVNLQLKKFLIEILGLKLSADAMDSPLLSAVIETSLVYQ
jgi:hypothetical protein